MTATRHDGSRLHWMEPVTAGRSAGDFAERTLGATRGVALATAWPAAFASWVVLRPLGCCPPLTVPMMAPVDGADVCNVRRPRRQGAGRGLVRVAAARGSRCDEGL
jgi:hypothetical protein